MCFIQIHKRRRYVGYWAQYNESFVKIFATAWVSYPNLKRWPLGRVFIPTARNQHGQLLWARLGYLGSLVATNTLDDLSRKVAKLLEKHKTNTNHLFSQSRDLHESTTPLARSIPGTRCSRGTDAGASASHTV